MTQTKTEIKAILNNAGINPLKRFGQHFLIDANLMNKLVVAAEIQPNDVVLEVGTGTGNLTERLLKLAGGVVAVEIDKSLYQICSQQFQKYENLTLIHGDILKSKSAISTKVLKNLKQQKNIHHGRALMVANLPYQIASPLIIDLLMADINVSPMCFTVQAEVAQRILAEPGTKTYGPISIFTQAMSNVKKIARVPPDAFWPKPKVYSIMIKMDVKQKETLTATGRKSLSHLARECFKHRRKTMHSNLKNILSESAYQQVEKTGIWDLTNRPEQITVGQWIELAQFYAGIE
ncbi:MAG: 16S rRNA (adenine(1518)-N(6)/adenine(1519)-N(6))-dimethyltransferase RsmA [Planctomycetota bacterium]